MSGKESEDQDLKAFEAALGSLRPRTDRLDPSFRAELVEEATGPHPQPLSQRERGETSGPLSLWERVASTSPLSLWERVRVRASGTHGKSPCTNPSGHCFLCIHCGSEAAMRGRGRSAWPAALVATASLSAVLLVLLLGERASQVERHEMVTTVAVPNDLSLADAVANDMRLAVSGFGTGNERILSAADWQLPDDVAPRGKFLVSRNTRSVKDMQTNEAAFTNHEFLRRLLKNPGADVDASDLPVPKPSNSAGSRS